MPQPVKLTLAIILVIGGVAFAYFQYKKATIIPVAPRPTILSEAASSPSSGPSVSSSIMEHVTSNPMLLGLQAPNPEERAKIREELLGQLSLTADQRVKLDEIEKKYEGKSERESWMDRMKADGAVLTPEQRQKAGDFIQNQFRQRIQNSLQILPQSERDKFMSKFDERATEWRKRIEKEVGTGQDGGAPKN
ncbi:MAG: hypothetical protein NTX50_06450 [Candidatus Sumerlaeota bacterium]|nr:hypothetical protein [Candidatus Sumerlaeota bacterium]